MKRWRPGSMRRAAHGALDESLLAVYRLVTCTIRASQINCIGLHVARLNGIGQVSGENVIAEMADQFGVTHRKHDLDSPVQVSRHQIGTAEVYFFLACVPEIVDSTVLQETPHNTRHLDVFAHALDPGTQAAYPPHQQINLNASL